VTIRLVLADDHVLVRQGLRKLLESAGFVVAGEAADGREAVRLVHVENPDLAVIDIGMPQFNGLNAALEVAAALIASDHDPRSLELVCMDERLKSAARREGFTVLGA